MDCNRWSRHIHSETKYTLGFSLGWDKKKKKKKKKKERKTMTHWKSQVRYFHHNYTCILLRNDGNVAQLIFEKIKYENLLIGTVDSPS